MKICFFCSVFWAVLAAAEFSERAFGASAEEEGKPVPLEDGQSAGSADLKKRMDWRQALLDADVTAAVGGSLIILTGALADAPEAFVLGGFMAGAGCAKAFRKR